MPPRDRNTAPPNGSKGLSRRRNYLVKSGKASRIPIKTTLEDCIESLRDEDLEK